MELILKQDVQNLGFKDDVVTVKNGYGRNFLIPQGAAILATPSAKKVLAEALKALEIKITAKAGGDKLFGSVTNANIAEVLEANGHSIDRKFITSGVVKRVGKYTASVRLHRDVIVELAYEIVGEKA